MTLSDAIQAFGLALVGTVSEKTHAWYIQRLHSLNQHLGHQALHEITITSLHDWKASLLTQTTRWADHPTRPTCNSGLAPATVAGHIRAAKRLFNWLEKEGFIQNNPARRLKYTNNIASKPKAINPNDLAKILQAARDSSARDYAIICFTADTGCRLGGLANLRVEDLDLDRLQAVVIEKGNKTRAVYYSEETARALRTYLEERTGEETSQLWLGRKGPLTRDGIYRIFFRLAKKAGVKKNWNPHAFRHGWARNALSNGASLGLVSQVLGHTTVTVTHKFYGQWAQSELGEAARKFSPIPKPDGL